MVRFTKWRVVIGLVAFWSVSYYEVEAVISSRGFLVDFMELVSAADLGGISFIKIAGYYY